MGQLYQDIGNYGVNHFYSGEISQRIILDMQENGGLLAIEDLQECTPEEHPPLWGTFFDYKIATNNPPGGGVMLVEMLNILEEFDLKGMGHNSVEYIKVVSEVMKIATIDKDTKVGDPKFTVVPTDQLTSKSYAKAHAEKIKRGDRAVVNRVNKRLSFNKRYLRQVLDRA